MLAFLAITISAEMFIWEIKVSGNEKNSDSEILYEMSEFGVKIGARSASLDLDSICTEYLLKHKDVSWIRVNIIGNCAEIVLREKATATPEEKNHPSSLVALCDGSGRILWSWHLWVSNNAVTTVTSNGLEWMDRNLGALNNDPDDIANRGMLYQWGRKEPFLPSSVEYMEVPTHSYDENYELLESEEEYYAIQTEIEAMRSVLNINNTQRGDGSYEWIYVGLEAPVALNAPGNIDYALNHPTTILGCRTDIPIGEYLFDWYLQQNLVNSNGVMMQAYSELWGSAEMGTDYKTIFDPCPPGYCVPPSGAFGTLPKEYACTYLSRDWRKGAYGWTWLDGENYFPAAGNLDVSGLMGETSERMLYWTAESDNEAMTSLGKSATLFVAYNDIYYGIYPLLDGTVPASWYSYGARAYAASVRCVRETNIDN